MPACNPSPSDKRWQPPNSQLQTALAQFTAQPGITPAHEAQLRATIASDARLLEHLNQAAVDGHLKGFTLSQAGAQPNLTGTYDKASGVVTLPSNSFAPTGTTAGADLSAVLRLQDMALRFAQSDYDDPVSKLRLPVTQEMVNNLQSTINGSPTLAQEMKKAVTPPGPGQAAPLQHFAPLSGTVAGGTYDGDTKTMSLPPSSLAVPSSRFNSVDMTFVLGHETQHAFNHAGMTTASQSFNTEALQIAQSNSLAHDYTGPIERLIRGSRKLTLPIFAALVLAACAQFPAPTPEEPKPMNTSTETYRPHMLDEYPDLTPEEMGRRMLKLIDSLNSFDELSLERVRRVTQLRMAYAPAGDLYSFTVHLPPSGWYYGIDYHNNLRSPNLKGVTYQFLNDDDSARMTPVCAMDYDAYVTALKDMGFQEREDMAQYETYPTLPPRRNENTGLLETPPPNFRRLPVYFFARKSVVVQITRWREADAPDEKLRHACVQSIAVR